MKNHDVKIEQRMQNMRKLYIKVGELIDRLPDAIPEKIRSMLKDKILGDVELKKLMDGIDANRPPRIFLIGRTGVGKSSLINALCGAYIADVSDVKSGTSTACAHKYMDNDRVLMEIMDTRGIAESDSLDEKTTAEEMLIEQVKEFSPDVAILVLGCTHRDDVDSDVEFLKKLTSQYAKTNKLNLPVIVVINKCDEMNPARHKDPREYTESKIRSIEEKVKYYKEIIVKHGLKIDDIIAVSSLIDWMTPDGIEIDAESIGNLPKSDIGNLQIAFDGRYRIEELLNILEKAILDTEARMGLRMAFRLDELAHRLAGHLNKIFSAISAAVAITPIPISDIYILLIIQAILVALIASLSGRDVSLDSAKEFIFSLGGIAGLGYAFRLAAQQATKLVNAVWPGVGSAISSSIALVGTSAIGKAAIAYYIDGKPLAEAKKKLYEEKEKCEVADDCDVADDCE